MNKLLNASSLEKIAIQAGARSSPLSKAQVEEVQRELQKFFPDVRISPLWLETIGDRDRKTSLRTLEKTDFFTKEIDELLLSGKCRIGIHSAKDLPDPIPEGLKIVAVTKGVDSSDSLVLRPGDTLKTLNPGAKIATSSVRREDAVRQLRADLSFIDIRGNIGQRLAVLEEGGADGVVIAEAALIRLGLTHLNRIKLPGDTVPGQGQLAVMAREDDSVMVSLFSLLDRRPSSLYLGLNLPREDISAKYLHYPVIKIVPRNLREPDIREALLNSPQATHFIFTSKNAVSLFLEALDAFDLPFSLLNGKIIIATGAKTARSLENSGISVDVVPRQESAEGIIQELDKCDLERACFFWPHSALSRPVLREYFSLRGLPYHEVVLYDTHPQKPGPHPSDEAYDDIIFTSPSTVDAYINLFGSFPKEKGLKAIGPVTAKYLTGKYLT